MEAPADDAPDRDVQDKDDENSHKAGQILDVREDHAEADGGQAKRIRGNLERHGDQAKNSGDGAEDADTDADRDRSFSRHQPIITRIRPQGGGGALRDSRARL